MRATKIIATLGPAIARRDMIRTLLRRGVNVFRINFSHGSHEQHLQSIKLVRSCAKAMRLSVALLGDLQGPKIRIGKLEGGFVRLKRNFRVVLTTRSCLGNADVISVDYRALPSLVRPETV